MKTIWISKYALTQGVFSIEAEIKGALATVRKEGDLTLFYHGLGRDWHLTKDTALWRAEDMRKRKIDSLRKQITKLKRIIFLGVLP